MSTCTLCKKRIYAQEKKQEVIIQDKKLAFHFPECYKKWKKTSTPYK